MIWKAAGTSNLFLEAMKVNTEEKLVITPLSLTLVSEITASEAKTLKKKSWEETRNTLSDPSRSPCITNGHRKSMAKNRGDG